VGRTRPGDTAALRRRRGDVAAAFAPPGRQGPGPHPALARLHAAPGGRIRRNAGPGRPRNGLPRGAWRLALLPGFQRSRAMIEVLDLHKAFGKVKAVDGVSFRANDGQITGLLGPNGAGKTTSLRMLY